MAGADLAIRSTVRELVATFAAAELEVRESFARIVAAEERINSVFSLGDQYAHIKVDSTYRGTDSNFADPDRAIARMRRLAWQVIIDRLEISRASSIARHEALLKRVKEEDPPELTEENVVAFVNQCAADLPTMWLEALGEIFQWLRPGPWSLRRYATNRKNATLELGPRIIIAGAVESAWNGGGFRVAYHLAQKFRALDNVFSGLAGQGTVTRTHQGPLADAIAAAGPGGHGSTEFFEFRCYRNRSLHVRMIRLDLLAELNRRAGGANLRPAPGVAAE